MTQIQKALATHPHIDMDALEVLIGGILTGAIAGRYVTEFPPTEDDYRKVVDVAVTTYLMVHPPYEPHGAGIQVGNGLVSELIATPEDQPSEDGPEIDPKVKEAFRSLLRGGEAGLTEDERETLKPLLAEVATDEPAPSFEAPGEKGGPPAPPAGHDRGGPIDITSTPESVAADAKAKEEPAADPAAPEKKTAQKPEPTP